ncbi:hypothetical protein BC826DRAFT_422311 [Russula brevipes]|nr:hypothetical protein BC826DRAFT_422311 [Russula brevipes]
MSTVKRPRAGVGAVCHENGVRIEHVTGPLARQAPTIGTLPDDALLQIFGFFADESFGWWHTLVHVCQRWRSIVFAFPRHLNLRLHCTEKTPVRESLDVWPALPIVVMISDYRSDELRRLAVDGVDNIIAALERKDRVCKIDLESLSRSVAEGFVAEMQEPFPELSCLLFGFWDGEAALTLPDSFLGGSAPHLREFSLFDMIRYPALQELLLSARGIVTLRLEGIHYISPAEMVTSLSTLTSLQEFSLSSIESHLGQASPPVTRTILPTLTSLQFAFDSEYVEDFVARVDTPSLQRIEILFFTWHPVEVSQFRLFIHRTVRFNALTKADVVFQDDNDKVKLLLFPATRPGGDTMLQMELALACYPPSSLTQLFRSTFPSLSTVESLDAYEDEDFSSLHGEYSHPAPPFVESMEIAEWAGFLHVFTAVKELRLSKKRAHCVARDLKGHPGQRAVDVLPALQTIFLEPELPEPVLEAIGKFVAARERFGHPVAIGRWERVLDTRRAVNVVNG